MSINRFSALGQQLRKVSKYLILFSFCFILALGCNSQNQSDTNPIDSNRISVGTTLKPRTLDPADNYELAGLNIIYNVAESLYTYEVGTTNIKPLLATEMPTIDEAGLTYIIPLRTGVTFHDGAAFNAKAMEFSLQRFIDNGGKPSFLLGDVIKSVEATGEYELKITLKQPFAAFPALLAFPGACAVSPQAYKIGAGAFNPNKLVGTGRYKLNQFKSDSISLDRNPNYWGQATANQGINLQVYGGNSANLFNSFETKAVDVAYQSLDPQQIESLLENKEKHRVIESSGTVVNYLVLNLQQEPLNQPEVRQAIAASINRGLINDRVLKGQAEPIYSLVSTAFPSYEPTFKQLYGEANTAQAQELLTKAGYSAQNPAIVEIWYPSGSITRGIVAETIKAYGSSELAGMIQFVPKSVESASFFSNLSQGIYPAALVDWYPDFLDPDNYLQPFLSCSEGSVKTGCKSGAAQSRGSFYYSDRANKLIEQSRQEQDVAKRQAILIELQEVMSQDVPYIPLWQTKDYAFAQNDLNGVVINPSQTFPFWTIKRSSNEQ
ncbi:peptide ABC transporter substrate-binding protein [Pleurocapsa sp. CCALA 161]|uniref:ABC transporter substrate-binding protein n=1 Tax=Pleurocapsa sp. CCALA 161 TaxID=2107688 RepID=UPI000D075CE8|nr:ABC transporter substrate-binding protein [Pleurocapsa sp. CCALA 161]PSB11195.1 peptide ABC transporter substrate-binding protein [Pleurocapsa sp. CCALA 161]